MKVYSPWDEVKSVMYDNQNYELPANGDIDLADEVAAHVIRKLGETGVRLIDDDPAIAKKQKADAETAHTAYLQAKVDAHEEPIHPDIIALQKRLERLDKQKRTK
jgi:hypothetical protein